MLKNGNKDNCDFSDEIVSYLYNELAAKQRDEFETHLADCMLCTDEFAAVANTRFSVFEWHKEDFSHLSTPEIVIPCEETRTRQAAPVSVSIGFAEYVRRVLSIGRMSPLMTAAAVAALIFGAGLIAFISIGRGGGVSVVKNDDRNTEIASNTNPSKTTPAADRAVAVEAPNGKVSTSSEDLGTAGTNSPTKTISGATAGRRNKRTMRLAQDVGGDRTKSYRSNIDPTVSKAPKLSNFDEPEDKSLRLTALFDQVDSL